MRYFGVILIVLTTLIACGEDSKNDPPANKPPVAEAGSDQSVNEKTTVTLDGSTSTDPDGTVVSYLWEQIDSSSVKIDLKNAGLQKITFVTPDIDHNITLTFRLTVTDNSGSTSSDEVNITIKETPVENQPPVADAGSDQTVDEKTVVTLNGSASSDPDGSITTFLWEQIENGAPAVTLTDSDQATATFTAPEITEDTTFQFQLTVTDNDGAAATAQTAVTIQNIPPEIRLSLNFSRIPTENSLDPFTTTVTITNHNEPVVDAVLTLDIPRGITGEITNHNDGTYSFTTTPELTGEYPVTVSYGDQTITRTPLVLQDVDSAWGQPQSVPGYVNTAGYEDGVTISPDGEYLFVQTGPYRWSSLLVFSESRENGGCGGNRISPDRCEHPWINEITGTITAPERPDFFDGRFSEGKQLHNAASWGVGIDGSPILALTTMFYGFKRQPDGTFKEPFYMAFNDLGDGIIGPFGLSFMPNTDGTHTTIFALKDSFTSGGTFDIYHCDTTFGINNNLGDYVVSTPGNPPKRGDFFPSIPVNFGDLSGTQGNPFLFYTDQTIRSIWTDDEYDHDGDTHKLTTYVLTSGSYPDGTWEKILLPETVNQPNTEAIQPTFTPEGLYFTQNTSIAFAPYSGTHTVSDLENSDNWGTPEIIIQKDTTIPGLKLGEEHTGKIVAIGEPTVATLSGKLHLYFVYAYIRGIDPITGIADLDFQAGFIVKR